MMPPLPGNPGLKIGRWNYNRRAERIKAAAGLEASLSRQPW
jgi:hypothetical protein